MHTSIAQINIDQAVSTANIDSLNLLQVLY